MGGTTTLQNTGVGVNGIGGTTGTAIAPPVEMKSGQKKFAGRGGTRWSTLTAAVNFSGTAATTQKFSKKY